VKVACEYNWKALNEGYNFASNIISIGGLETRLWAPKVVRVLILGSSKLPLGSPKEKCHLGAGPVAKHIVYYKGEGGGIRHVQAMVNLMNLNLPMVRPSTKSAQTMH
jgi:hypothetical protein